MKIKPLILYIMLISTGIWILGFCFFCAHVCFLPYNHIPKADAIVVLTGGANRINEAFKLFDQKAAPLLFISGVNKHVSKQQIVQHYTDTRIQLDHWSNTTYENAIATKKWIQEKNIKSILLVTSFYHIPRSLFEFKSLMPDIQITPVPIFSLQDQKTHWTHTRSAWLMFTEYNKFIIRFIQFQIRRIFL